MKKSIKVSIICSVYNREKYINQCVDSILNSSLKDIELILIDNGCTDSCPKIIDEYAKKDSRVVAVHNPIDSTYGYALNLGISMAQGKYIGIVESDDFIHHDMYKKLYDKAEKSKADVVFAGFYIHNSKGNNGNHLHNRQIFENSDDTHLFSIMEHPFLLTCHQSIWAKLYNAKFLKTIKFDEKGRYIDSAFIVDICCATKKLVALKEPVYYYRDDNPDASQSNTRSDKSLMRIIDDWDFAKTRLKHYGMYDVLKEAFYYQASKASIRFYGYINKKYKKEFFDKYRKFLDELKHDKSFQFEYFEDFRKKFFQNVMTNNFRATLYDNYKSFCLFGVPLYEKYEINNRMIKKLFGIKLYEKIIESDYVKRKYLYGIITSKRSEKEKVKKFMGIRIYRSKKYPWYTERKIFGICTESKYKRLDKKLTLIIRQNADIAELTYQSQWFPAKVATLHQSVFPQFKDKHAGQDTVVVGCGPSMNDYEPIKNAIHISCNRAFRNKKIKFDYGFIWDLPGFQRAGDGAIEEFLQYDFIKFVGKFMHDNVEIPEYVDNKKGKLYRCYSSARWWLPGVSPCDKVIHADLSLFPLADFMSVAFGALHFASWTHPRRIYLVGLDTVQNGSFDGRNNDYHLDDMLNGYELFKNFMAGHYPDTEIISINPIGLRGVFHDVYTREFLQKHPEIKNVEVLE